MNAIARLLSLAALLPLAGCVLAIGSSPDDDEGKVGKRLSAVEKRLEALEEKCGACTMMKCLELKASDGKGAREVKIEGGKLMLSVEGGKPMVIDLEKDMKDGMLIVEKEIRDTEVKGGEDEKK